MPELLRGSVFRPAVPGALSVATPVEFGMLGVTEVQRARLNVVAFPPDPWVGQLSFVDSNGAQVGNTLGVQLAPGQVTSEIRQTV
jgi:hypothetical protein